MPETLASSRIRNFPIGIIMEETNEVVHSSFWANLFKPSDKKLDNESTLASYPPFLELSRKNLLHLSHIIHNRHYIAGEHIFAQGDPGMGLYIIPVSYTHLT